jgi:hypothetical protein
LIPLAKTSVDHFKKGEYDMAGITAIRLSIPNTYIWLLMFYGMFHSYLNFFGELTKFSDRKFYLDWWNSSNFGEYWRLWNLVKKIL